MASLQRFTSHGRPYWRLVESYRRPDGRPAVRTLLHLGRPDDLLARLQAADTLRVRSVSCGAVDALRTLAQELGLPAAIDAAVGGPAGRSQRRDGLSVGTSLTAAVIARLCHPSRKRAVADWAATTTLPRWLGVPAAALTSQHFWDQMAAVPPAALEARARTLVNRQYVREVLRWAVVPARDGWRAEAVVDPAARARLEAESFGLRILATTREDWSTAQIIEAYRGQARVERAFRDLKDPWVGACRPQDHWTDQQLIVHALLAVLALLLGRVLLRRAQAAGFRGSLHTLISRLAQLRRVTLVSTHARAGRPRVREQLEEGDEALQQLAAALQVRPAPPGPVASTRRRPSPAPRQREAGRPAS